jgi:hypothetical protein
MTFEKTYELKNNELTIKLPRKFKSIKRVRVIVEELENEREQKLKLLKNAASDSIFNADIEEIKEDFQFSDKEAI